MGPNDMVFHKEGENITAGAFKIKSDFLSHPAAKLYTGGNSNTFLDGLAVPAGLLLLQQIGGNTRSDIMTQQNDDVISDSLYDRLLKLVTEKKTERKTRKDKKKVFNRKTKKQK